MCRLARAIIVRICDKYPFLMSWLIYAYILVETVKLLKKRVDSPTLVFCNKSETCYWLSKSLTSMEIKNHLLTGYDDYEVPIKSAALALKLTSHNKF